MLTIKVFLIALHYSLVNNYILYYEKHSIRCHCTLRLQIKCKEHGILQWYPCRYGHKRRTTYYCLQNDRRFYRRYDIEETLGPGVNIYRFPRSMALHKYPILGTTCIAPHAAHKIQIPAPKKRMFPDPLTKQPIIIVRDTTRTTSS